METTAEIYYRLQHRHKDGSWGDMEQAPRSSASQDPERKWGISRLFRCTSCDEGVTLVPPDQESGQHNEA